MPQVYAGFICGYGVAILSTPLVAVMLLRMRAAATPESSLGKILPPTVSLVSMSVILHGGLFMFWTAIGLLLGLILLAMKDAGGAAGSLNLAFTLFVAALTLAIFAPVVMLARGWRLQVTACAVAIVLAFGWLMPYLAKWSNFSN